MDNSHFQVQTTADGRFGITTKSRFRAWRVTLLLMFRYGFRRRGVWILPLGGEGISPSFHRGELEISAGYDNWSGYDWGAENAASDTFLRTFYRDHCSE